MATGIGTPAVVDLAIVPAWACEREIPQPANSSLTFRAILGCRWQRGTGVAPWVPRPGLASLLLGARLPAQAEPSAVLVSLHV